MEFQYQPNIKVIRLAKLTTILSLTLLLLVAAIPPCHAEDAASEKRLKGRIESIFVDGEVYVPVELQATAGKFDESLLEEKNKPRILHESLKSFPTKLRGEWNGVLRIVTFSVNNDKRHETSEAHRKLMKKNRKVDIKLRFHTPGGGKVVMAPPIGKFQKSQDLKQTVYMPLIDPTTGKQAPPPGGGKWQSLDRTYDVSHELLFNKVSLLSKERAEQDLFLKVYHKSRRSNYVKITLSEHIWEFERVGRFHLKVKLAEVDYDNKGVWLRKALYEGEVH